MGCNPTLGHAASVLRNRTRLRVVLGCVIGVLSTDRAKIESAVHGAHDLYLEQFFGAAVSRLDPQENRCHAWILRVMPGLHLFEDGDLRCDRSSGGIAIGLCVVCAVNAGASPPINGK